MKKGLTGVVLVVLVALAFVAYNSLFTVHQTQQALLLQFGDPKRQITKPGLHFKLSLSLARNGSWSMPSCAIASPIRSSSISR